MEQNLIVPGLKEAAALAINDYNWTPVRKLLEVSISEDSVEYTQLQQIDVNDNIIEKACSTGFTELVSVFLNSGFPVNCIVKKTFGRRLLHLAANNGHLFLVKLLLNVGADIDCKTYHYKTPLFYAVRRGHFEVMKYLISAGADVNTRCDKSGKKLLDDALRYHTVTEDILQLLIDSVCNSNTYSSTLYWAVRSNNIKYSKILLKAGAHVNGTCIDDDIPLHVAAWNGNIRIMELLLEYGADINARDKYGSSAMHEAVYKGKLQSVEFLIEHGWLINSVSNNNVSPLSLSIICRQFDIAMLLINSGADLKLHIYDTVLNKAVRAHAPIQLIECLLEHGASVTAVDEGRTALQYIIFHSNYRYYSKNTKLQIAKLLLIYGFNHYVEDRNGNTLLHWACRMGDVELVEYLIDYGFNVDAKNREGKKPYDIAAEKGYTNIVKAIIHYYCNKYTTL